MKSPNAFKWSLKFGLISALTGMICCVAPAILFMFGLMGGVVAISFADFFYAEDGSLGTGSILLRILAFSLGIYGFIMYRKKQNQCSIDPKRKTPLSPKNNFGSLKREKLKHKKINNGTIIIVKNKFKF